ncbi:MAG: carbon-nitrogen hydrolase family protein [Planctomycetota bacterium]
MAKRTELCVGAFQFKGSADVERNTKAILRGMKRAAKRGVQLLALHECALTGDAGVELTCPGEIDRRALKVATQAIVQEAARLQLTVALGTTTFTGGKVYNSLQLIDAHGRSRGRYHKRAMYGEDAQHYEEGEGGGVYRIGGLRVGLRICFEFRFPEYFRELLAARVDLAVMGFSMVGPDDRKRATARAHLMSRAAENGIWILAANNLNGVQNAPTCLIDPDGNVVAEASTNREALIVGRVRRGAGTPLSHGIAAMARALQAPSP